MAEQVGVSMGPATDRKNDPVMDPTANVVALVHEAVSRQDDLRQALETGLNVRLDDLKDLLAERQASQRTAMETAFASAEKAVTAALNAAEKATDKAESAAGRRFEDNNHVREEMVRQVATFMPRKESEANWSRASDAITALSQAQGGLIPRIEVQTAMLAQAERLNELTLRVTRAEGQDAGAGVVGQLAAIRAQIDTNSNAIITNQGVKQGSSESKGSLYAILGAIATIVVVVNVIIALATK